MSNTQKRGLILSKQFSKDIVRLKSSGLKDSWKKPFNELISDLCIDAPLDPGYCDHPLKHSPWVGYRDAHVLGDLVLIYKKTGDRVKGTGVLELARIGSHSELFGKKK